MYDATHDSVSAIPLNAAMVAGYVSDHTAGQTILWTPADWARFPAAVKVRISGDASIDANVLDMEAGAAAYSDAPGWLARNPTGALYFSLSAWSQVEAALQNAGIDPAAPPKWVAWYNGVASLSDVSYIPNVVAKQYSDPGGCDLSVVVDYWPGVDPVEGGTDMPDQVTLDWTAKGAVHAFFANGAALHHSWPGGPGEDIVGENNELGGLSMVSVTGVIDGNGTCNLDVRSSVGGRYRVYQGPTESQWHVQGDA